MDAGRSGVVELIRLAYEGVLRKQAWGEMLELACRVFRSQDAYLGRNHLHANEPSVLLTHGVDPKVAETYAKAWAAPPANPVLTPLLRVQFRGVVEPRGVVPRSELERTEFYDVCRRPRNVDAELGCGDTGGGGRLRFFSVNRARNDLSFGERERRLMAFLFPHLMLALEIDAVLSAERTRSARPPVDSETLNESSLERVRGGRPLPRDPAAETSRRDLAAPIAGAHVLASAGAGAGTRHPLMVEKESVEHLTPHESLVMTLLSEGRTSDEICAILGIGINTLNTHLKHLFQKTGCHARSQLVSHFWHLRLPGGAERGGQAGQRHHA